MDPEFYCDYCGEVFVTDKCRFCGQKLEENHPKDFNPDYHDNSEVLDKMYQGE